MTLALSTEGLIGSSPLNGVSPVITVVSPTVETTPGEAGGFPDERSEAVDTPIVLTITDSSPGLAYVTISARHYDELIVGEETVYRTGAYRGLYLVSSESSGTYTIRRDGGWPSRFIELNVDAIDAVGNVATSAFVWELPSVPDDIDSTGPVEDLPDVVTAGLRRLPSQYGEQP